MSAKNKIDNGQSLNLDDFDNEKTKDAEKSKDPENNVPPISFFSLFRYATGLDKTLITLGVLCSIVTGLMQPINTLVFGTLTGDIITIAQQLRQSSKEEAETLGESLIDAITKFATYNSLIGLTMITFTYFSIILFNYSCLRQILCIRKKFFSSMLNQDITWYDLNTSADFATQMSEDLIKLEDGIGEKVSMFINHQIAFVASIILAFIKGWELALICLTSLPVTMISVGIVSRITSALAKKEVAAYGVAGAIADEVLSSIRTVVAFGGQEKEISRYNEKLTLARDINIKRGLFSGLGFGLLWFFIYASYALAFWYGVGLVLEDMGKPVVLYDSSTMVIVFFSVMMGSMNFGMSSPFIESFGVAKGAGAKIFNIISNKPIINLYKNKGEKPSSVKGKIIFKNVDFHYPSRSEVPVLQKFNLTINPGETVALVGSSGCGKSTCIQLLQRFYDPINGSIILDDNDINHLNLRWLRNNIGVVGQEPILFNATIAENIKYGNRNASQNDIEQAAITSNAHDFIMKLPQGYNTLVGERGAQLSGGQKQRIAIARAIVRNPAILLLDEATSALDTNSEAQVQDALNEASKKRTTIVVAHRLSTIRNADKIIVLSQGRVIEQGQHDQLMAQQSAYYNLVTAQIATETDATDLKHTEQTLIRLRSTSTVSNTSIDETKFNYKQQSTLKNHQIQNPLIQVLKMNAAEWPYILIGSIASLIMGAAMPVFAVLFGDILGVLSIPDKDYVREETNWYSLYFVIAGIATGVSIFIQMWVFSISGEKLTMRLRGKMFEAMLKQEMGWFDDKENSTGSLCSRLSTEAANVQGATGQRIGTILQSFSTLALAVGLAMSYEYRLGLVAVAFTPLILIATFLHGRLLKQVHLKHRDKIEKANKLAVEAVTNIRTVASLVCEETFEKIYISELIPAFHIAKRDLHFRGIIFGLARGIMFFAYSACMYYGGILIKTEGLEYAKVFKVSQALIMGTVSIANALAFAPNFQKGLDSITKILEILNRKPLIDDAPNAIVENWKHANVNFDSVYFSYPSRSEVPVLNDLQLSIEHGKTIALVGPSGCGKSTIIQLIERFYYPLSGTVQISNQNIQNYKLANLRSQLGIVSQEPVLFDRTIGENIAYGNNDRNVRKDEIIEVAKKANIHNFIISLPMGYDTKLGDKGAQLSGGQKQRVAIARALLRNPKILLLDEATSALDTESEKVVQDALDKAKEGRTCIMIAHRLSTIQDADVICVINKGKIVEYGTHKALLNSQKLYHKLYSLQNR